MASRHATKYRDSSSNIKVLLRQQTNLTLNDRFHKVMKMTPAPRPRSSPPRNDARLREELRQHQRKLESLERNTLTMMSRSLASLNTATASTLPIPTAPVYNPPKPSAKARLGGGGGGTGGRVGGTIQNRIGAKKLTQKYSNMQRNNNNVSTSRNTAGRLSRGGATVARGAAKTVARGGARGGASTRGATRGGARGGGTTRGGATARGGARGGTQKKPDKDELDSELDKYMSKSKAYLDNQLDSYMAQKGDKEAAS